MRQIVLDTETTGLETRDGHRIIEIGCVEMIDRKMTGNNYHQYLQPDRLIDEEALAVHGITPEFLSDKPRFNEVARDFLEYIQGAELIIHNAPFDIGFLNYELSLLGPDWGNIESRCKITDSLVMAREMYPGQRNSLDALCKRLDINNSHRELHGALLDSEILGDVYLGMTGGQVTMICWGVPSMSMAQLSSSASGRSSVANCESSKLPGIKWPWRALMRCCSKVLLPSKKINSTGSLADSVINSRYCLRKAEQAPT